MDFGQVQELKNYMLVSMWTTSTTKSFLMTWKITGHLNPTMTKKLIGSGLMNMISTEKISPTSFKFIFLMNMRELLPNNSKRLTSKQSLNTTKHSMLENSTLAVHLPSPKEMMKEIFLFQRPSSQALSVSQVKISSLAAVERREKTI